MATPIELMALANDRGFQRRVKYFMQKQALAEMVAGPSGPKTDYAKAVLGDPSHINNVSGQGPAQVLEMCVSVTTDPTVAAAGEAVSDTDLEAAVVAMWPAMSGITGP